MKKLLLLYFFIFLTCIGFAQCTHTIRLTDTFGDGWTGNRVSVSVNGAMVLTNLTLTSGYGPVNYTFTAATGSTIRVWRSVTGSWTSECRTQILVGATPLTAVIATATGTATSGGTICVGNCAITPPLAPANDLICNATLVSCGQTISGTTLNATNSGTGENLTCGISQPQPGVWYKIVGNGQIMTASLCGTIWDSKISIFSGSSCSAVSCIGGNDDYGPACGTTSASYSWNSVIGTTYYILVHGYSTTSAFSIYINCVAPPTPGPCTDVVAYGSQFMPVFGGAPFETVFCQYAGEFSTWSNAIANTPYIATSTIPTDWITVRSGTWNGPVVAVGLHPLSFTPIVSGLIFIHINTNSICGTQSTCRDVSVSRVSALPVELMYFEGSKLSTANYLEWATASEHNTIYFDVEKSEDGFNWRSIGNIPSAGNSTQELHYELYDNGVEPVINYYRLKQFDIDGASDMFGPIQIDNRIQDKVAVKWFNLAGQEVDENSTGFIMVLYNDGTIKKIIQ